MLSQEELKESIVNQNNPEAEFCEMTRNYQLKKNRGSQLQNT